MRSLPPAWVDALFAKLTVRYGVAFLRQYPDLDPELVKADWSEVLSVFAFRPEAIRFGLDNLPADKPLTALQFRALCSGSTREERQPMLPAPAGVKPPASVMAALQGLKTTHDDPHAWAKALMAKREAGQMLSSAQSEALQRFEQSTSSLGVGEFDGSGFRVIPAECLPPAMRAA